MEKSIVISSLNNLAAILHNEYLYELIVNDHNYQLGNIYMGTVNKVYPTVKAIFVTIQINRKYKNGFIHANDLRISKSQKSYYQNTIIVFKQKLYVQIVKEAFFGKSPRLSINITLAGRYIVFSPLNKIVCISRKIVSLNQKEYLKALALILLPLSSGGMFFRRNASKISTVVILEEWKLLRLRWILLVKYINCNSHLQTCFIYQDVDLLKRVIRDFYQAQIKYIFVDSLNSFQKLDTYLHFWKCFHTKKFPKTYIVSSYFSETFKLHSALSQISSVRVELIPTGYIFIESFEALTVIDVNSGFLDKYKHPLSLVLSLNCCAAKEIAYQIKTRNISGIIIIDFVDMNSKKDQLELLRYLHKLFKLDKTLTQLVQFSELGLVEITRERTNKNIFEILLNNQVSSFSSKSYNKLFQSLNSVKIPTLSTSSLTVQNSLNLNDIKQDSFKNKVIEKASFLNKRLQYSKKKYFLNILTQKNIFYIK